MSTFNLSDAYIINKSSPTRKKNDYYPTPPIATEVLVDHVKEYLPKNIWEPAAGRGWISDTLIKLGYNVTSTDLFGYDDSLVPIETGVDYLETSKPENVEAIITNPPYKSRLPIKFLEKSLTEVDFTAMFLRLTFMEGKTRHDFFRENPPEILVFSDRMNCEEEKFGTYKGQMGGMIAYGWFIWSSKAEPGRVTWVYGDRYAKNKGELYPYDKGTN